ncbi:formate dehydrogenase accessory sulfurtransferase FdhD [Flavipsychrobacter stenotrophus]|uniref:Sulfur carrier protein FdhD n=1 Tax=Flavipsychrobacter stenotrophus TaxID=2077091 RepID=A0A2S7SWY9_9BACT|nr:formate dehydrogenase accessory sulfurtransferase FdhD [Flavipsychrobacter stenotrophus]PQJ11127.1 formate dehydrogenase accessory sulfurtransferase FdhD [Flavipsychrobacter stenotrophus]
MQSTSSTNIIKVAAGSVSGANDILAVEEPLEIRLAFLLDGKRTEKNISVTMRTPGNDEELVMGFLFTEGIITSSDDIATVSITNDNIVTVSLKDHIVPTLNKLDRNFYTTSSCGVCGKASIDAVKTYCDVPGDYPYDDLQCTAERIISLPGILRDKQAVFEQTGGLHACAIFTAQAHLLNLREDVGRHNALDKLIGASLSSGVLPLSSHILLLSGRASFELVQKAAMAGVKMIAAVGAPSSLAVQMAEEWNITLIGFLRGERFNIYSGAQRIVS